TRRRTTDLCRIRRPLRAGDGGHGRADGLIRMRICHVTPHLPPDQAANALLPAHLGRWFADLGHTVAFVTPQKMGAASDSSAEAAVTGTVARTLPRSSSRWQRLTRIDSIRRARSIVAALD